MNQNGIAKILIIGVITTIAITIGGYFISRKINQPQKNINQTNKENVAADETASWKIYQNSNNEFSFKYPAYWKMGEMTSSDISSDGMISHVGGTYRPDAKRVYFIESELMDVNIEYWTKFGEEMNTLQDWIERREDDLTNLDRGIKKVSKFEKIDIVLDGITAKKIIIINTTKFGEAYNVIVFVQHGKQMYQIEAEIGCYGEKENCLPIFDYMLSTFKFFD
jgi:hypothetical protein